MSLKIACACSLLALAAALPACGSKANTNTGTGQNNLTCDTTYSHLDPTPVSFTNDVMPIFGFSCHFSDCHNSNDTQPRAALQLGPDCQFDLNTGACTYPTTSDPNADPITAPQPLSQQQIQAVYGNLVNTPSTTAPAVMRVVPGHPEQSFLMMKMAGLQNNVGLQCMNQDTTHEGGNSAPPCGVSMPQSTDNTMALNSTGLCQTTPTCNSPDDCFGGTAWFNIVARWVAQGAMAN
jgi:hypothetical protein